MAEKNNSTERAVVNKELIGGIDNGKAALDTMILNIQQAEKYRLISEDNISKAQKLHNDAWYKQQEEAIRKRYAYTELAEKKIENLRKNRDKDTIEFARTLEDNLYKFSNKQQKIKIQAERQATAKSYQEQLKAEMAKVASMKTEEMHGNSKLAKLKELRDLELKAGREAAEAEKRKRALGIAELQEKKKYGNLTKEQIREQLDAINTSFELERQQHEENISNLDTQIALLEEKKKSGDYKDAEGGGKIDQELEEKKAARAQEEKAVDDNKKQQMKDGTLANVMKGVSHALNEGLKALSDSINKSVDEAISTVGQFKSTIDARLQGTQSSYESVAFQLKASLGASAFVKQKEVLQKLNDAVDKGIAYNVEQRAFLATVSDKIVKTFDAFDANLMRIIRLQQADTTAARMGMEAELLQFFNSTFSDNSYLTDGYDQVSQALVDANAQMTRDMSIAFEYNVQKWLGSLSSLGFGTDTITTIAQGINYLGSGNVQALAGNTQLQSLLAMSASRAGLSYSELLVKGIDDSSVNILLRSMVEYLAEIAEDNNAVVKAAYGDVFNFTQADLRAIKNLTNDGGVTLSNISNQSMTYSKAMSETQDQLYAISSRLSMTEMIDNVFDNFLYTAGESIGSNMGTALTWKLLSTIEGATGGIHLPAISVMGNMIDLSTFTIEGLAKTGIFGLSALANLPLMTASILSGGGLNMGIWGYDEYTKRGGNYTSTVGGVQSSISGSKTMASGSSSDTKKAAISDTEEDQKSQKKASKETMKDEVTIETLYKEIFDRKTAIYTIDVPVKGKLGEVITAVDNMRNKTNDIYKLINKNVGGKGMLVEVTKMPAMSMPNDFKPKSDINISNIDDLAKAIGKILLGTPDGVDQEGVATVADIANILAHGVIRVYDDTAHADVLKINRDLF